MSSKADMKGLSLGDEETEMIENQEMIEFDKEKLLFFKFLHLKYSDLKH